MKPELSPSFASPKSHFQNFKYMKSQKEEMINVAKKILENINLISFVNLNDQQVHSIMRMREIARRIVDDNDEEVTKDDVDSVISCSVEKMASLCKDVDNILSRLNAGGLGNEHLEAVWEMKEIVSTVLASKRAKLTTRRTGNPGELVDGVDVVTVDCKVGMAMATSDKSTDIGGRQKMLFSNEMVENRVEMGNEDRRNENQGNTIDGPLCLEIEDVQGGEERYVLVVDGETEACNDIQSGQADGTKFDDVEEQVEGVLSVDNGENRHEEIFNGAYEHTNENGEKEVIRRSAATTSTPLSVIWPSDGKVTLDWVKNMMSILEQASKEVPPSDFQSVMPIAVVDELIIAASSILSKEPNCVEVNCHGEESRVVVVGDIHGQFHDLLNLFKLAGSASKNQFYVFNGDYVDRGAWGIEVVLVLLAWKVLMPNRVYLLRGNHETQFCTSVYGFEKELKIKFGDQGNMVYMKCLECFKQLPLASIISNCAYTTHGGLFRSTDVGPLRRSKRKRLQKLELGSLEDLSKVNRYLIDLADEEPSILTDALWSDPSKDGGLLENANRGFGLSWGPDCTETFLKNSKLKLIIRSHQGPDARVNQNAFGDMLCGYSMDHVGESGKLYTLFSAPSYPQFGETMYNNDGAYAVLKPPNFDKPSFHSFKAVERPKVDLYVADNIKDETHATEKDLTSIPITRSSSMSEAISPSWNSSKAGFEALGISDPPSWSISLADNTGGTKIVQVPRAPSVGLPLHSNLQEPHKAAFEYLFELVAALKHMLLQQEVKIPAGKGSGRDKNGRRK